MGWLKCVHSTKRNGRTRRERKKRKHHLPYNVLVTFDPILDGAPNHDLLLFTQTIRIGQIWRNFKCPTPPNVFFCFKKDERKDEKCFVNDK